MLNKYVYRRYVNLFYALIIGILGNFLLGCGGGGGGSDDGSLDNAPPVVTAPSQVEVSHAVPKEVTIEIVDPEANPVTISWIVYHQPDDGDLSLQVGNDFKTITLSASVIGEYAIQAQVSDGTNSVLKEINVTVKDFAPSYTSLELIPELPHANTSIHMAIGDLSDLDGDYLTVVYHWYVNGEILGNESGSILPALLAGRGDTVSVHAEISDGTHTVQTESLSVELGNCPPTIGALSIQPSIPDTTDDIRVSPPSVNDADGDSLTVAYAWTINGQRVADPNPPHTLPAGSAVKGDVVSVIANVTDGLTSVSSSPLEITIADAPVTFEISGLPDEIQTGQLLAFDVSAFDPDESASGGVTVELTYGPATMTIDASGRVQWTPNELMLLPKETFNFGFKAGPHAAYELSASVVVADGERKLPLSRSGIEVPYRNHSMWIDDYDGDDNNEILLTDSNNLIYTLEYDGEGFVQDWLYPFATTDKRISQVLSRDITDDGRVDIIVVAEDGVSVISDPTKPARTVFSHPQGEIAAAAIGNLDSDPEMEIALIVTESSDSELRVYQFDDFSLEYSITLIGVAGSLLIGNVDTDSALEIVIDSGYVVAGPTGIVKWYHPSGFGQKLAVGDIDDSGIDSIVGTDRWQMPKVFSAEQKSELWEIAVDDICTINILNVDADPQEEILIGNCQWGEMTVYDGSTGAAVQEAQWDTVEHASISVTAGDVDNDSDIEVVWGSGITSTGEDVLVVGEFTPAVEISWYNQNPSQLDTFSAAGWATIAPGSEQAVFVVPETDSGYGGQRLVTMNLLGEITISEEISTNWDNARHGKVVDYDKDGYDEIFLATAALYDGEFQVRQLNDNSLEWGGAGGEYENNIRAIEAADMNNDGHEDALVVDGRRVNMFDIVNQTILWTSTTFDRSVYDVAALSAGSDAAAVVVAAHDDLSIWIKEGNLYIREHTSATSCGRIQAADTDGDGAAEIFCLAGDYLYSGSNTLIVFDHHLQEQDRHYFDGSITDFIIEETEAENKNILAAYLANPSDSYYDANNSSLALISPETGDIVWQSHPLLGEIPSHNLFYLPLSSGANKRLTFATEDAMYITK